VVYQSGENEPICATDKKPIKTNRMKLIRKFIPKRGDVY